MASGSALLWRGRVPPDLQEVEAPATPDECPAALRRASGGAEPQAMLAPAALEGLRYRDAKSGATLEPWCGWEPFASHPLPLPLALLGELLPARSCSVWERHGATHVSLVPRTQGSSFVDLWSSSICYAVFMPYRCGGVASV